MDIVTKKQLNILIQLAEADKHFATAERDMIFKIARDRKFPDDSVQALIKNPEPIGTLGALLPDQKFDYLLACIELIFVDQKVFESELIFARSIAIKLGFKKSMVDFLVENYQKMNPAELKTRAMADFS
jgi:hypothetical protein